MKLSIIICTYNSSKTLSKTLDSVLEQKEKDYEVLIIDGVSSDNTLEIVKNYEKKFNGKLRFSSEKDKGVYDAMNKGIQLAKGEWIYFLGSDDVFFSENVLEKVKAEIEKSDLDVLYGNVKWGDTEKIYDGKFSVLKLMKQNICHQAMFFRKSLFEKLGKFDLKYKIWADYLFNIKCFNDNNVKCKYIEEIIAKYSTNGFSSKMGDAKFVKDKPKIIEKYFPKEYADFYNKIEEKEQELKRVKQELNFIKSSKFWKMREEYLKLKDIFLFKKHF